MSSKGDPVTADELRQRPVDTSLFHAIGLPPQSAAVAATSGVIIAANLARVGLVITNTGNKDVYLSADVFPAVAGAGVFVAKMGGTVRFAAPFSVFGPIYAITDGGSSTLAFQEYIRDDVFVLSPYEEV